MKFIERLVKKYLDNEDLKGELSKKEFQNEFYEIYSLKDIIQDKIFHPEGDVLIHISMMLEVLKKEERNKIIFWSILYHDCGKRETYPNFKNHGEKSLEIFKKNKSKLYLNKNEEKEIEDLILYHEEILKLMLEKNINEKSVKELSKKVNINNLLLLYKCDVLGRGYKNNKEELESIDKVRELYNLQKKRDTI
ncbi:HD domain-containing protein [Cetobacterium ceti]|uniref:HD domain-containing protein n=1 Tax=Cetobacterium ceti TaxID=180163 RepID=A0A1T4KXZ2_9FUSO|nr:HD domain-containing protein [Cetobacterium ceti]SJZ47314.1 HD domain-containing protein [Cetobacterium ceti]